MSFGGFVHYAMRFTDRSSLAVEDKLKKKKKKKKKKGDK